MLKIFSSSDDITPESNDALADNTVRISFFDVENIELDTAIFKKTFLSKLLFK